MITGGACVSVTAVPRCRLATNTNIVRDQPRMGVHVCPFEKVLLVCSSRRVNLFSKRIRFLMRPRQFDADSICFQHLLFLDPSPYSRAVESLSWLRQRLSLLLQG
jgi:hypothetical protein